MNGILEALPFGSLVIHGAFDARDVMNDKATPERGRKVGGSYADGAKLTKSGVVLRRSPVLK